MDEATGLSPVWVGYIKNTIARVACNFTTNRMLTDYCNQYYIPQAKRTVELAAQGARLAREIAAWKQMMLVEWRNIRVVSIKQPEASYVLSQDNMLNSEVSLDLGRLRPEDIGVEVIFTTQDAKGEQHIQGVEELKMVSYENGVATYRTEVLPEHTGMYQVAKRVFPKNPLLPHRQDFPLVKWL